MIYSPEGIEARSMEIIESELSVQPPEAIKPVVMRVIHCTADLDYAENLVFSDNAVEKALSAMQSGCDIITDTQMAMAGINKTAAAKLGCSPRCFMSDAEVAGEAKQRGCTRAMISMEKAAALGGHARLSALLMILMCPLCGLDQKNALRIFRRDRCKHASPYSAQTESVCAGALGVRLAGDAIYGTVPYLQTGRLSRRSVQIAEHGAQFLHYGRGA